MKDKKTSILILLILLVGGFLQATFFSPLTPKAAAVAHFKINSKMIPNVNQSTRELSESEIKDKYGRLELLRLMNNSVIRGVIFEQGKDFIRVDTDRGVLQIPTDQVDTVEIIR